MFCKYCHYEFYTSGDSVGGEIRCPNCTKTLIVENKNLIFNCPYCSGELDVELWMIGASSSCPHCQSEIVLKLGEESRHFFPDPFEDKGILKTASYKNGDLIGKYRIVRCLGIGGMGEVYLVEHTLLNARYALKLLKKDVVGSHPDMKERLLREARLAIKIQHPNLIEVIDAEVDEQSSSCYIVMEYVDGVSIEHLIANEYMLEDRALEIITAVAEALKEASSHGVIHRDIKPANIMLSSSGDVKLADLGVAKINSDNRHNMTLTMDNAVLGTPNYASPEQLRSSHNVDCRADIYGLGATLYHMLTGKRPFESDSVFGVMANVLEKNLPPVHTVNPDVSVSTSNLIARMMAKNKDDRPENFDVLLSELANGRKFKLSDLKKWFMRHKWQVIIAFIVVVSFAAVFAGYKFIPGQKKSSPSVSVATVSVKSKTDPVPAAVKASSSAIAADKAVIAPKTEKTANPPKAVENKGSAVAGDKKTENRSEQTSPPQKNDEKNSPPVKSESKAQPAAAVKNKITDADIELKLFDALGDLNIRELKKIAKEHPSDWSRDVLEFARCVIRLEYRKCDDMAARMTKKYIKRRMIEWNAYILDVYRSVRVAYGLSKKEIRILKTACSGILPPEFWDSLRNRSGYDSEYERRSREANVIYLRHVLAREPGKIKSLNVSQERLAAYLQDIRTQTHPAVILRKLSYIAVLAENGFEFDLEMHKAMAKLPQLDDLVSADKIMDLELQPAKAQGITFSDDNKALLKCPGNITSVIVPFGVTTIGVGAFYGCGSLTKITLSNSVTTIGNSAFYGCSSLTEITLPDSVTAIGDRTFWSCSSLTKITLPNSVTTIGNSAFSGCSRLTKITLPNSVTTIGDCAFYGCSILTKITLPDSVTTIGDRAFAGCANLKKISINRNTVLPNNALPKGCQVIRRSGTAVPTGETQKEVSALTSSLPTVAAQTDAVKNVGTSVEKKIDVVSKAGTERQGKAFAEFKFAKNDTPDKTQTSSEPVADNEKSAAEPGREVKYTLALALADLNVRELKKIAKEYPSDLSRDVLEFARSTIRLDYNKCIDISKRIKVEAIQTQMDNWRCDMLRAYENEIRTVCSYGLPKEDRISVEKAIAKIDASKITDKREEIVYKRVNDALNRPDENSRMRSDIQPIRVRCPISLRSLLAEAPDKTKLFYLNNGKRLLFRSIEKRLELGMAVRSRLLSELSSVAALLENGAKLSREESLKFPQLDDYYQEDLIADINSTVQIAGQKNDLSLNNNLETSFAEKKKEFENRIKQLKNADRDEENRLAVEISEQLLGWYDTHRRQYGQMRELVLICRIVRRNSNEKLWKKMQDYVAREYFTAAEGSYNQQLDEIVALWKTLDAKTAKRIHEVYMDFEYHFLRYNFQKAEDVLEFSDNKQYGRFISAWKAKLSRSSSTYKNTLMNDLSTARARRDTDNINSILYEMRNVGIHNRELKAYRKELKKTVHVSRASDGDYISGLKLWNVKFSIRDNDKADTIKYRRELFARGPAYNGEMVAIALHLADAGWLTRMELKKLLEYQVFADFVLKKR